MDRMKLCTLILVFGGLIVQNVEMTKEKQHIGQADTDDGGPDDAPLIIESIERKPLAKIKPVTNLRAIQVPKDERSWNKNTIAPDWLIAQISELQAAVVGLRRSYDKIVRGRFGLVPRRLCNHHAAWACNWVEVHFPDYFACVTEHYIDLMFHDRKDYPKGLLITIQRLKELFIISQARKIPIYKLNPDLWERMEFSVNGLLPAVERHRMMLEELAVDQLRTQSSSVKKLCRIPSDERHPFDNKTEPDPDYVFDEDYEPVVYNRL